MAPGLFKMELQSCSFELKPCWKWRHLSVSVAHFAIPPPG